jgi:DNA-binding NarL/FixJ family response regulator
MDAARRDQILEAYLGHSKRFDEIATRSHNLTRARFAGDLPSLPVGGREPAPDGETFPLSRRQRDVLSLVAAGFPNHEIGTALNISVETVKTHVQKILQCLGARNRAHAVFLAYGLGLLGDGMPLAQAAHLRHWLSTA